MPNDKNQLSRSHAQLLTERADLAVTAMKQTRRFVDARSALAALLQRSRELSEEGVLPRQPLATYLDTVYAVLRFVAAHPALHGEPTLSPEMCGAVLRIAEELRGESPSAPGLREPLCVVPPLTVVHEEALRTGVLLLSAYREAVRKALRGPKVSGLRAEFGIGDELGVRDGAKVHQSLGRFLAAAERFPELVAEAGLTPQQLAGLAAQERTLLAYEIQRQRQAVSPSESYRNTVLHLALEYFFDRYSAALLLRMLSQPEEQLRGMRLLPRAGGARSSASGRYLSDMSACQVTDSGRLVFA